MKPATEKQVKFAKAIADALGIELPAERTRQSLFLFIRDNKPRFEEKKSAAPDEDPDSDWAFMDAMGIDSVTGGFADNY